MLDFTAQILGGALLGGLSNHLLGWKMAHRAAYRVAAIRGETRFMLRHFPYWKQTQVVAVPLGALFAWLASNVFVALLAGPATGLFFAASITLSHRLTWDGQDARYEVD